MLHGGALPKNRHTYRRVLLTYAIVLFLRANKLSRASAREELQLCAVKKVLLLQPLPGATPRLARLLHLDIASKSMIYYGEPVCRARKLIRTFNAHPRRRHRLSRIDHASFIFFFIWRWLSGPRVYPSSRTIGSGRKLRGGCAHIGAGLECFCLTSGVWATNSPTKTTL